MMEENWNSLIKISILIFSYPSSNYYDCFNLFRYVSQFKVISFKKWYRLFRMAVNRFCLVDGVFSCTIKNDSTINFQFDLEPKYLPVISLILYDFPEEKLGSPFFPLTKCINNPKNTSTCANSIFFYIGCIHC